MTDSERRTFRLLTLALAIGAVAIVWPFWAPLVLAVWTADLVQPALRRLQRLLHGRRRGAAAIVVLLVVAILVPLSGVVAALAAGVRDLLVQVRAALEGHGTFTGVLLGGEAEHATARDWADLASRYGANAWRALAVVARASASVLLAVLVFIFTLYAITATGSRTYRWLARHLPIPRDALRRLALAFRETGRGLIVGGGGTALVQGLTATVAYVAIGIPRALILGPLTAVAALVPAVGTGLVWIPLAVELAVRGDYLRAALMTGVGAGILSLIDNFVRPVLTRHARLTLPSAVILVSMLGGIAVFGAAGALLGPLVVRLAVEAVAIARENAGAADGAAEPETRAAPPKVFVRTSVFPRAIRAPARSMRQRRT